MQNNTTHKYDFSLTSASLRLSVMIKVAQEIQGGVKLNVTEDIGGGNYETGRRMYGEIKKRLSFLTEKQLALLLNGSLTTQKQIAFLAVCKCFDYLREFVIEVLREKVLVFDYQIYEGEYRTFYRRKSDLHLEMDDLTENSKKKVRQVLFKILEQADLIDNIRTKVLQPQLLDKETIEIITEDNPNWLKIFFFSDIDIANTNI